MAALATACSIGNEPPTAEVPDVQVPSMGSTVGPHRPQPRWGRCDHADRYGPALNVIGRLQGATRTTCSPGIHINDQNKFVLWVFTEGLGRLRRDGQGPEVGGQDRARRTGRTAAHWRPHSTVMALVDKVHAAVLAEDTGSFGVGPDFGLPAGDRSPARRHPHPTWPPRPRPCPPTACREGCSASRSELTTG